MSAKRARTKQEDVTTPVLTIWAVPKTCLQVVASCFSWPELARLRAVNKEWSTLQAAWTHVDIDFSLSRWPEDFLNGYISTAGVPSLVSSIRSTGCPRPVSARFSALKHLELVDSMLCPPLDLEGSWAKLETLNIHFSVLSLAQLRDYALPRLPNLRDVCFHAYAIALVLDRDTVELRSRLFQTLNAVLESSRDVERVEVFLSNLFVGREKRDAGPE